MALLKVQSVNIGHILYSFLKQIGNSISLQQLLPAAAS